MSLVNYTDLVTATQSWLMDRSDIVGTTPDFIALGEAVIWYGAEPGMLPLRCREMETVVSLAPSSGVVSVPSDYLQYRRVIDTANPRRNLDYITPAGSDQMYPSRTAGLANHFTVIGSSLYAFPLTTNNVELTYYARAAALTASAPTNWLMTKHPGIYLRAALMQAAEWIKNDQEFTKQAALLKALIGGVNRSDGLANQARAGVTFRTRVA